MAEDKKTEAATEEQAQAQENVAEEVASKEEQLEKELAGLPEGSLSRYQVGKKTYYKYMDPSQVRMVGHVDNIGNYIKGIEDYIPNVQYQTEMVLDKKYIDRIKEEINKTNSAPKTNDEDEENETEE